jgi:hypothetical protein
LLHHSQDVASLCSRSGFGSRVVEINQFMRDIIHHRLFRPVEMSP